MDCFYACMNNLLELAHKKNDRGFFLTPVLRVGEGPQSPTWYSEVTIQGIASLRQQSWRPS